MTGAIAIVGALFLLSAITLLASAWRALRAWRQARGVRLVTCPETHECAAVSIDAGAAAATAFIEGVPNLRLATCSRWATRERCDEPCLGEVRSSGRAATVESIASEWYAHKRCALCGKTITADNLLHHYPALLGRDGVTTEWPDAPPEQLPALFETHRAICWDCHSAEHFRRTYPDMVVDRPTAEDVNP